MATGPLARARRRAGIRAKGPVEVEKPVKAEKPVQTSKPVSTSAKEAEEAPPPTYKEVGLGEKFLQHVKERQQVDDEIAALGEVKKKMSLWIMSMLERKKVATVVAGDWRVTRSEGKKASRKLDEKLLLLNGVAADVIAKSKVEGKPGEPYLVVTEIKPQE